MIAVRTTIVRDEHDEPVEVRIDYQDWLEIKRLLDMQKPEPRRVDLSRFAGKLRMELTEDPVAYQRRIRDEWE